MSNRTAFRSVKIAILYQMAAAGAFSYDWVWEASAVLLAKCSWATYTE